jgi:hypothetical protein
MQHRASIHSANVRSRYAEVIKVLYTLSRFHFNSMETFDMLPKTILPQRFHSICSLSFTLTLWHMMFHEDYRDSRVPPHDEQTWNRTWDLVRSMQGLRDCHVVLHMLLCPHETSAEQDMQLLGPIRRIGSHVRVTVIMHWGSEQWAESKGWKVEFGNMTVLRESMYNDKRWPKWNSGPDWPIRELQSPTPSNAPSFFFSDENAEN